MKNYKNLNTLAGWIVFLIASFVYLSTIEPTASFWDCGEFIAASYKLEVGHPPGAPFFLLIGRIFTLFAGSNKELVATMVNAMSALASAFTILFLFWSITHLVKKMISKDENPETSENIVILGAGLIGALAYTFSDSFWFSAVEGEVYASSSLFTAVVFWAILKWENVADEKYADRWLVLIAYLMGLSIGVHLLNLLALPAIVFIYYFKKYTITRKGILAASAIAMLILGGTMYVIIPGVVKFAGVFELLFVNVFGLPYWSGVGFYLVVLTGGLIYLLKYTLKKGKVIANTAVLMLMVILIGYSSYAMIVIRSAANPPMDQNNPETLFNLLSYLNREQYGDRPLAYGQYFNAPAISVKEGKPTYAAIDGKYKVIGHKTSYNYDNNFCTLFPRMYSSQGEHIDAYIRWTGMKKSDLFEVQINSNGQPVKDRYGETVYNTDQPKNKPGFTDNIRFFVRFQLGHMYFRYFMWNFSGRQNDIQCQFKEEITKGNWLSGIRFLDASRLGNQGLLPDTMKNNKAKNHYYLLPLVLGLIGLFFQSRADTKNFSVVMLLFFFTGIAIVIYLNQYPIQPRERDYAFSGSFYAFAIWIGIAVAAFYKAAKDPNLKPLANFSVRGLLVIVVLAVFDITSNGMLTFTWTAIFVVFLILVLLFILKILGNLVQNSLVLAAVSILMALPAPMLMAGQNWDDHNRSQRYFARDMAANYLNSCEKNAVLYTNGDNDTFPLWYAQEVEGIRTDVRVINLSYLSADWYIDQMRNRAYESSPLNMTLTHDKYEQGKRDVVYLHTDSRIKDPVELNQAIEFVAKDDAKFKLKGRNGEVVDYIPQNKFWLAADSSLVFGNGTITPEIAQKYTSALLWTVQQQYVLKNHLMVLDFLASNNWQRPIYYAITVSNDNYVGLDNYFAMSGLAYRIVPANMSDGIGYSGGINTKLMYDNMVSKFKWGGIEEHDIYIDENISRMLSNMRFNFGNLATSLISEGKFDSARTVLTRCLEIMPNEKVPFDYFMLGIVENYYQLAEVEKAQKVAHTILQNNIQEIEYLLSLENPFSKYLDMEKRISMQVFNELIKISGKFGDKKFNAEIQQYRDSYGNALTKTM